MELALGGELFALLDDQVGPRPMPSVQPEAEA
jgi:hypothetical protein